MGDKEIQVTNTKDSVPNTSSNLTLTPPSTIEINDEFTTPLKKQDLKPSPQKTAQDDKVSSDGMTQEED